MTQTAPAPLVPTAQSLEPIERLHLREQLQDLWRSTVERITELAVRFHTVDAEDDTPDEAKAIAKRLSQARLDLAEIEAAMRRLDVGRYGVCEACFHPISFGELVARPDRRRCASCDGGYERSR